MGLDIRVAQLVVHIGCPKSILSYWQDADRCARDGRQGFSLILYDGFTLALKTTDKDMTAVVKNDSKTCIRKLILETLGDEKNMSMSQTSLSSCEGYDLQFSPCCALNIVQYVLQNVNAKRGASLMYIHFIYMKERVRWIRIASLADCKRIFGENDVFIGFIIKKNRILLFSTFKFLL